jgi:hypothetical protein
MTFLTPVASLVVLVVVVPLATHALLERRAHRVSRVLGLRPPSLRSRPGVPLAIFGVAALLAFAAAQPVVAGTQKRVGRADAEVYLLFDSSRSMLAKPDYSSPNRLSRAKDLAFHLRQSLADVPVGILSLTDRVLPYLFPTLDAQVFASTLQESIGIERPPPTGTETVATDFGEFGSVAENNYFKPTVTKRLLVIFSDGESRYFDAGELAHKLRGQHVRVLFVHLWGADDKVFLTAKAPDPGYRPDPASRREAAEVAAAGDGKVFHDGDGAALASAAKAILGHGPATTSREQRTRVSLAPYVALSALFPLSFVLYRRNFV